MRILMVCLGNICRSPIAEGILKHKAEKNGLNWTIDSAGTESYHIGEPPHRLSEKICMEHGIDISTQRARQITRRDLVHFDKIYALADDVYHEIKLIAGHHSIEKVDYFLNELYISFDNHVSKNDSVPDPYYSGEQAYRHVYDLVDKTCNAIIKRYK